MEGFQLFLEKTSQCFHKELPKSAASRLRRVYGELIPDVMEELSKYKLKEGKEKRVVDKNSLEARICKDYKDIPLLMILQRNNLEVPIRIPATPVGFKDVEVCVAQNKSLFKIIEDSLVVPIHCLARERNIEADIYEDL